MTFPAESFNVAESAMTHNVTVKQRQGRGHGSLRGNGDLHARGGREQLFKSIGNARPAAREGQQDDSGAERTCGRTPAEPCDASGQRHGRWRALLRSMRADSCVTLT